MGRPKPLLDWFGAPLVQRQVEALLRAGAAGVIVVTGHRADEVAAAVPSAKVSVVRNDAYRDGKATSVRAGVTALPADADAVLILAVDQPRPSWLIRRVLEAHHRGHASISIPRYQSRGGHPLVFDAKLVPELQQVQEETQGIRQVVRRHESKISWVEMDTPLVRVDLNTPEAYEEAKVLFEERDEPERVP